MAAIRIGIGGWNFPEWRGRFYPAGLPHAQELAYASAHLTSIEINGTFYRHQSPASFAAWRDATPDGFVFSVKAHRATTHGREFGGDVSAVARFLESGIGELREKLGPVFWQFPHTRKFDASVCGAFLASLPRTHEGRPLRHAIEARHPSFDDPAWVALLREHRVALVLVESGKQALRGDVTADFVYARLQMNEAAAEEGYDSAALDNWAARLKGWSTGKPVKDLELTAAPALKPGKLDCFAYFISGDKERAPDAAMAMLKRLSKGPKE
jgi:uncharacterized protein YecE (DUF72 family)